MRLEECYRLLEVDAGASAEEIRRAHRDLTKVWHPDRFGDDAALRRKAEEKLKAINEAYETILGSRPQRDTEPAARPRGGATFRHGAYAVVFAFLAIVILLRRPSPAGLVIALVLFVVAFLSVARMRVRR
jgi:DnaJ domain